MPAGSFGSKKFGPNQPTPPATKSLTKQEHSKAEKIANKQLSKFHPTTFSCIPIFVSYIYMTKSVCWTPCQPPCPPACRPLCLPLCWPPCSPPCQPFCHHPWPPQCHLYALWGVHYYPAKLAPDKPIQQFGVVMKSKITGETPEVSSDNRKPKMLLRHR